MMKIEIPKALSEYWKEFDESIEKLCQEVPDRAEAIRDFSKNIRHNTKTPGDIMRCYLIAKCKIARIPATDEEKTLFKQLLNK
jgi:hypothetical protein